MVTVGYSGKIVCEGLHFDRHGGLWRGGCEEHDIASDHVFADVVVPGGCRHEHVEHVPLCGGCFDLISVDFAGTEWRCGICLECEQPHDCVFTFNFAAVKEAEDFVAP